MNIFKLSIISIYLLSIFQLNGMKTYSDGTKANVLDVAILLEKIKSDKHSSEENKVKEGKYKKLVIIKDLRNFINNQEAIILSAPLFRGFLLAGNKNNEYKKTIKNLFYTDKWSIFATNDYNFAVLIPTKKYTQINSRRALVKIGLNPKQLFTIKYADQEKPIYDPNETYNKLKKQNYTHIDKTTNQYITNYSPHLNFINALKKDYNPMNAIRIDKTYQYAINLDSLLNLFLDKRVINIRAYISGHGSKKTMANLQKWQFKKLRDKFNKIGCEFLYVCTCYGGSTGYDIQTKARKNLVNEKSIPMSSKKFIEIYEGIPKKVVRRINFNIDDFFIKINKFMKKNKEILKKINKKLETLHYFLRKLGQKESLLLKVKSKIKIAKIEATKLNDYLKKSKEFKAIFIKKRVENMPSCRFPWDIDMKPMPYLFPKHLGETKVWKNKFEKLRK